jgi:hypothetical protein
LRWQDEALKSSRRSGRDTPRTQPSGLPADDSGLPADEEPDDSAENRYGERVERARLGNQREKSTIATGTSNSVAPSTVRITVSKALVAPAETSTTTEALPRDLAQEAPPDHTSQHSDLGEGAPSSARDSLLEAMQAEKARVAMELGSLATERVIPRKLPSLEISPRLATSPSLEISPKLATGAADGHTQALVTEPVDAGTKELGLEDVDGLNGTENVAADALRVGGKAPLPPLVAQREQPELPDEQLSVESVEQAKLQPGRLAPLPSTAKANGKAIHTDTSSPTWRKAPMEALEPIGR